MCAVLGVGMAICASWGLAAGFGIMFTPLHLNIPFLLLGLGVDDAFILVSEFQRALRKVRLQSESRSYYRHTVSGYGRWNRDGAGLESRRHVDLYHLFDRFLGFCNWIYNCSPSVVLVLYLCRPRRIIWFLLPNNFFHGLRIPECKKITKTKTWFHLLLQGCGWVLWAVQVGS